MLELYLHLPFLEKQRMVQRNNTFIWCNFRWIPVASALAMGADLAYMGTRFIATEESEADDDYKKMLIDSAAKDVVIRTI